METFKSKAADSDLQFTSLRISDQELLNSLVYGGPLYKLSPVREQMVSYNICQCCCHVYMQ